MGATPSDPPLFNRAQAKQIEKDAYERAAKLAWGWGIDRYGLAAATDIANRIRGSV